MRASFQIFLVLAFSALLALQIPLAAFRFRPRAAPPAAAAAVSFATLDDAAYAAVMRQGQTAWQMKARLSLVGAPVFDVGGVPAERFPPPEPMNLPASFGVRPPSPLADENAPLASIGPPSFAAPEAAVLPPEVISRRSPPVARERLLRPDEYSSLNERK